MSEKTFFLVTGMARSGTTLLEKLLYNHSDIDILSQPLPFLYRFLKKSFFESLGLDYGHYVLNDLFAENKYTRNDLETFLSDYHISADIIIKLIREMNEWSGQWTHIANVEGILKNYQQTNFIQFYRYFLEKLHAKKEVNTVGSKEILIEEFIPHFLTNDIRVIHIIRDPRDAYTSINYGRGETYAGKHRPTLLHIRNWRKSIAIHLLCKDDPNYLSIKYENLVTVPLQVLEGITNFLKVSSYPTQKIGNSLIDQDGNPWRNNSSMSDFENLISSHSVGRFKRILDSQTISYIEYTCWPEMLYLGYKSYLLKDPLKYDPSTFREPFKLTIDDIDTSMSTSEKNIEMEKMRLLAALGKIDLSDKTINELFSSKINFESLKF